MSLLKYFCSKHANDKALPSLAGSPSILIAVASLAWMNSLLAPHLFWNVIDCTSLPLLSMALGV